MTQKKFPKTFITGWKRHGKDTVAEIIQSQYGVSFESSSMFACREFIFDALKDKYGYSTLEECFNDRYNHRTDWFDLIREYNADDDTRLSKAIFDVHDIYVGIRSVDELDLCKQRGVCDVTIAVFDPRKAKEDETSMTICPFRDADILILNDGTLDDLKDKVIFVCESVLFRMSHNDG